ncbi:hypothetical protein CCR75_001088 [Bremia lactucae]|uniref:PDZ domain-containing protein n=1 Tax=Bremia lactucae TaxID=4779 RepID=A0A976IGW1_BRELC|nr:hypothetical protein CCR75_001088 [Bremia lactucae]
MKSIDDTTPSMELGLNLPTLVEQLKALRQDMECKSKLYTALVRVTDGFANRTSASVTLPPHSNSQLDPRASQMSLEDLSALNEALDGAPYSNTLKSRRSSILMREQHRVVPHARLPSRTTDSTFRRSWLDSYKVMWVSGECGISLHNYSKTETKAGAQIAVLQHADGVTTGINKCRLGDHLITINDNRVDHLLFNEILTKLKTTQRPIALGFQTNQNVLTSPRGASSPKGTWSEFSPPRSKKALRKFSSFTEARYGDIDDLTRESLHEASDFPRFEDVTKLPLRLTKSFSADVASTRHFCQDGVRNRTTSVVSSCVLSNGVKAWCKEQEEMHSDIIVLLTETIVRCEKLQQENLDQLQNLMQLSIFSASVSDRTSVSSSCVFFENTGKLDNHEALDTDAVDSGAFNSPVTTSPFENGVKGLESFGRPVSLQLLVSQDGYVEA